MQEGQTSKLIAIIDDNESMQDSLRDLIESAGLRGTMLRISQSVPRIRFASQAACLIVDILMPKMSGLELQAKLKQEECNIPIIFITAFDDAEIRAQAMKEGAVEFLSKPFDHQLLLKILRCTLDGETYGVGFAALCDCVQKRSWFLIKSSRSFPALKIRLPLREMKTTHSGALPIASRSSSWACK